MGFIEHIINLLPSWESCQKIDFDYLLLLTGSSLVLGIIVVFLLFVAAFHMGQKKNYEGGSLFWPFVITWFWGFVVYDVGMYTGERWSILGNIPMAIVHAFGIFVLESDVSAIHEPFHESGLFMCAFSIVHATAAFISLWFVIKHFGFNIVSTIKLLGAKNKEKESTYVFWGLNDVSYILAKDIIKRYEKNNDTNYRVLVIRTENDEESNSVSNGFFRFFNFLSLNHADFKKLHQLNCLTTSTSHSFVKYSKEGKPLKSFFKQMGLKKVEKVLLKTKSKIHFFFLSENEEENILSAVTLRQNETIKELSLKEVSITIYCHARYNNIHRVIEESNLLRNIEIRIVDSSRLSVELLRSKVDNHPVKFVQIDGTKNPGTVMTPFYSLVVGLGETGRDVVRFLYEYGAFMSNDSTNEGVKRSEFHCYIIDKVMDTIKGTFYNSASEAIKAVNKNGTKLLEFKQADTSSVEFYNILKEVVSKLNYIVVAIGNDEENMTLAVRILKYAMANGNDLKNFRILVHIGGDNYQHFKKIKDHYNKSLNSDKPCLEVFGTQDEVFSYDVIVDNQFQKDAILFYDKYQEVMQEKEPALKDGSWDQRRDMLLGFCKKVVTEIPAAAAMQRYNEGRPVNEKMSPTGLYIDFEDVESECNCYPQYNNLRKLHRQMMQDMSNAWHKLTKRELIEESINQNHTFAELHHQILQLKNPVESVEYRRKYENLGDNISRLILNLAITEHLRWNASHEMLGYKKGERTDEQKQQHNCLVCWEELDNVSKKACEIAKKKLEEGETWSYSFSREIQNAHPQYKNMLKAYVLYLPDYKRYDFAVVETTIAILSEEQSKEKRHND